jgi:hypothetical protein
MRTILKMALKLAIDEAAAGRNVILLFPDRSWVCGAPLTTHPKSDHGTVHIRCSTFLSGLKSVTIDTLILIEPTADTWDAAGEAYARERLRTSLDPLVIKVGEKP